jgi:hypothetical protein
MLSLGMRLIIHLPDDRIRYRGHTTILSSLVIDRLIIVVGPVLLL